MVEPKFPVYPVGWLKEAGVRVERVLHRDKLMSQTLYLIRYDCCETVAEMTHEVLRRRIRKSYTLCATCARVANGRRIKQNELRAARGEPLLLTAAEQRIREADLGFFPPPWPAISCWTHRGFEQTFPHQR